MRPTLLSSGAAGVAALLLAMGGPALANPGDPAGEPMEAAAEPAGVAAAAAGSYGPTSLQLKCKTLSSLSDWTAEHTLTVSPANPTTDDDIVVTYSFTAGPTNGPVPVPAGDLTPKAALVAGGEWDDEIELTGPAYGAIGSFEAMPGATLTGSFWVEEPGQMTLTVENVLFDHSVVDTHCNSGADPVTSPEATPISISLTIGEGSGDPRPTPTPTPTGEPTPTPTASASPTAAPKPTEEEEADTAAKPFGPKKVALKCKTLSSLSDWEATHTLTMSPENPGRNANVKITLTYDKGPTNGPVPVGAGELVPKATVKVGGVSGGTVELAGPAYGSINPETAIPGSTLTGNFVAKDPGLVTLTVATFLFDHAVVDTYCNSGADPETGPKDTEIVAEFTVKKKEAANPGTPGGGGAGGGGGTLPVTGAGGPWMLLLWATALLLPGVGLMLWLPTRKRRTAGI